MSGRVLVVDAGTSGVRAVAVDADGTVVHEAHREVLPASPAPGVVDVDGAALAEAALGLAVEALHAVGPVAGVGLAVQRATTMAWDVRSGEPVGPGIGWQDLRTVGRCMELRSQGVRVAPNQSATKATLLAERARGAGLPDGSLRLGTVDAFLAWHLTGGDHHVTDATDAQVTGLTDPAVTGWDEERCDLLAVPVEALPRIVPTSGIVGEAAALPGSPPLAALVGDQQASLVGQGGIAPGGAKVTAGTGAMLDVCLGPDPGPSPRRGTFPVLAWRDATGDTWAREAVDLAAGSCVEWLRDGLGLVSSAADTDALAASVADSGGVTFVPALSGLGTPVWDHGARGTLLGITRGTTAAHVVRAVLDGVAHRVADLVEATEADTGTAIGVVRLDGGMSANRTFVQAVADACGRPVEVSAVREATALGAAFLAGTAVGTWPDLATACGQRPPGTTVEPATTVDRDRWSEAVDRSRAWIPALSELDL